MLSPIQILTSNLLASAEQITSAGGEDTSTLFDNNGESVWESSLPSAVLTITFAAARKTDCLILHNTNAARVEIEYKISSSDAAFTPFALSPSYTGGNIFYAFPSTLNAQVIQITFTPLSGNFYAGSLALCERLMTLDKALSSVRPSSYFRGGHHYLASGALIAWKDFSKLSFDISLSNVPQDTAQQLTALLSNNAFLTYALYGGADAAFCKEFALSAPPVLNIERKTALCQIEFTLLER